MSDQKFVPIVDSKLNFQGTEIHQANPLQDIEIVVHFNPPNDTNLQKELYQKGTKTVTEVPSKRNYLTRKELESYVGIQDKALKAVSDYFISQGFKKGAINRLSKTASFKGNIALVDRALKVQIGVYQGPNRFVFLAYKGYLSVPVDIANYIDNITGITELLKSEYRIPSYTENAEDAVDTLKAVPQKGYKTEQLMKAYSFPTDASGKGECMAIIELGGMYKQSDLEEYFKLRGLKTPKIEIVGTPIDDSNLLNNSEVTIDIQIAGTVAPGAKLVVYYANTILEAMRLIIADTKNKPSVISCSWAGSEYNYSASEIRELNQVFFEAACLGITVIAASGDHGAYNSKTFLNVSIPSSHPLIIGCGGTTPVLSDNDEIKSDQVWNQENGKIGSGGGFSGLYPAPQYQYAALAKYPFAKGHTRGVPDLAVSSNGEGGYAIVFNGMQVPISGTSAGTPLIAGLICLLNEKLGYKLGFINTYLYQAAGTKAFLPILKGNNGYYTAANYWSPATGLGSPVGEKLLEQFKALEK
jgi:kumamolisin